MRAKEKPKGIAKKLIDNMTDKDLREAYNHFSRLRIIHHGRKQTYAQFLEELRSENECEARCS